MFVVDVNDIEALYQCEKTAKPLEKSEAQRIASEIFKKAFDLKASDIHIRVSKREKTQVLMRILGDLRRFDEYNNTYEWGVQLSQAIYQAMTDVSDASFNQNSIQDARISDPSKLPNGVDGIRIGTAPRVDGFLFAMRLLYADTGDTDLESLGYGKPQLQTIGRIKRRPTGITLIAGPTGSGKSTTLQRLLRGIIKETEGRKNVLTVEDPPEYPIPGAVQIPVTNAQTTEDRAMEFHRAIRGAMRLDPDVIMIGEIRDEPSAKLALQAALTGHQVWSTIHVDSAVGIVRRLEDIGIPRGFICDPGVITGLISQRLVKRLCPHCRIPLVEAGAAAEELERLMKVADVRSLYVHGPGCRHCGEKGAAGRTVISETIHPDRQFMRLMRDGREDEAIEYWVSSLGGVPLGQDALSKVRAGLIDPFIAEEAVGPLDAVAIAVGGGYAV